MKHLPVKWVSILVEGNPTQLIGGRGIVLIGSKNAQNSLYGSRMYNKYRIYHVYEEYKRR